MSTEKQREKLKKHQINNEVKLFKIRSFKPPTDKHHTETVFSPLHYNGSAVLKLLIGLRGLTGLTYRMKLRGSGLSKPKGKGKLRKAAPPGQPLECILEISQQKEQQ